MSTLTLVGRAAALQFDAETGVARWNIYVSHSGNLTAVTHLMAERREVLEQFERMDEGQLIGVLVVVPHNRQPADPLPVQRLELLGKTQEVARG